MSHRSEVLSDQQWDTIGPLLPELISRGRPWRSNREVFEGILWSYAPVPVGQIYRLHTLAHQRVGLDDVVGKKTGLGYGCGAG